MRFKEVLLPATEDEVDKELTSNETEDKLAEFASREQVENTLLDELEDTIDASDSDAELNALQTVWHCRVTTSNSDMKELLQEDVLEDEDIENLLEVSRHQMADPYVLIL